MMRHSALWSMVSSVMHMISSVVIDLVTIHSIFLGTRTLTRGRSLNIRDEGYGLARFKDKIAGRNVVAEH